MKTTLTDLGRLEKVDLREVWLHEAHDFSPWLAQDENIVLLAESLDLELEVEQVEKNVGPFKADILCRDTTDDHFVLIENQLESTDHVHLGQLLTYAAGLNAATIVWVAARFTEEHRAALDWLNEITGSEFHFFGLEIELWRIGNSQLAPKFNIVSKPNEWSKAIARRSSGPITESGELKIEFWNQVKDRILAGNTYKSAGKTYQSGVGFSIGRSCFHVKTSLRLKKQQAIVRLIVEGPDAKTYIALLQRERDEIEKELGAKAEWDETDSKQRCSVALVTLVSEFENRSTWPQLEDWFVESLTNYYRVFHDRISQLDAAEYAESED